MNGSGTESCEWMPAAWERGEIGLGVPSRCPGCPGPGCPGRGGGYLGGCDVGTGGGCPCIDTHNYCLYVAILYT